MRVEEMYDMLSTRRPPAIPRDYLQAYLEYARIVSDGAADSGRALLGRLVTERSTEHDRGVAECDGFTEAVREFVRGNGWKCGEAQGRRAVGLGVGIEDPGS